VIEVPEKGRDTTERGRATGHDRRNALAGVFRVLPFSARRQNRFDHARRPVNAGLDKVSGRSNRNPSNHSERSPISICLSSGVPAAKAGDRAPSPDGEESSAVAVAVAVEEARGARASWQLGAPSHPADDPAGWSR